MRTLVEWVKERPRVKHYLQEKALGKVEPLALKADDPALQGLVDQYNTTLADLQAHKAEATITPTGAWQWKHGNAQVTLQPNGRLSSTEKAERYYWGGDNTFSLDPRPDGTIEYSKVSVVDNKTDGSRYVQVGGKLQVVDGKVLDPQAFKPDSGIETLPVGTDETAQKLLEEYRKALTKVLAEPVGHYNIKPVITGGGFGEEYTHDTSSTPDSKTLRFDDHAPFHSQGSIAVQKDGSLSVHETSWCGWGTVHENTDDTRFTRHSDGSLEVVKSGASSKSWMAGRDYLTRPAEIVHGGYHRRPEVHFLIAADGHSTMVSAE